MKIKDRYNIMFFLRVRHKYKFCPFDKVSFEKDIGGIDGFNAFKLYDDTGKQEKTKYPLIANCLLRTKAGTNFAIKEYASDGMLMPPIEVYLYFRYLKAPKWVFDAYSNQFTINQFLPKGYNQMDKEKKKDAYKLASEKAKDSRKYLGSQEENIKKELLRIGLLRVHEMLDEFKNYYSRTSDGNVSIKKKKLFTTIETDLYYLKTVSQPIVRKEYKGIDIKLEIEAVLWRIERVEKRIKRVENHRKEAPIEDLKYKLRKSRLLYRLNSIQENQKKWHWKLGGLLAKENRQKNYATSRGNFTEFLYKGNSNFIQGIIEN